MVRGRHRDPLVRRLHHQLQRVDQFFGSEAGKNRKYRRFRVLRLYDEAFPLGLEIQNFRGIQLSMPRPSRIVAGAMMPVVVLRRKARLDWNYPCLRCFHRYGVDETRRFVSCRRSNEARSLQEDGLFEYREAEPCHIEPQPAFSGVRRYRRPGGNRTDGRALSCGGTTRSVSARGDDLVRQPDKLARVPSCGRNVRRASSGIAAISTSSPPPILTRECLSRTQSPKISHLAQGCGGSARNTSDSRCHDTSRARRRSRRPPAAVIVRTTRSFRRPNRKVTLSTSSRRRASRRTSRIWYPSSCSFATNSL